MSQSPKARKPHLQVSQTRHKRVLSSSQIRHHYVQGIFRIPGHGPPQGSMIRHFSYMDEVGLSLATARRQMQSRQIDGSMKLAKACLSGSGVKCAWETD
eukprot:scaffold140860_cov47-Prasinocladus_malaysianus.AAC.2